MNATESLDPSTIQPGHYWVCVNCFLRPPYVTVAEVRGDAPFQNVRIFDGQLAGAALVWLERIEAPAVPVAVS